MRRVRRQLYVERNLSCVSPNPVNLQIHTSISTREKFPRKGLLDMIDAIQPTLVFSEYHPQILPHTLSGDLIIMEGGLESNSNSVVVG